MTVIVALGCLGASWYLGYMIGHGNGYDQCEKDDNRIHVEMNEFWKEVEKHGV